MTTMMMMMMTTTDCSSSTKTPLDILAASEQAILIASYGGLKHQGWRRSLSSTGDCAYSGEGGMHCSIGFIADPEEGTRPNQLAFWSSLGVDMDQVPSGRITFLHHLQIVHDTNDTPRDMEHAFKSFAKTYGVLISG